MQMVRLCLSVRQLNSIVTSKIQFVKSNKDILIIGARLKYALLLFLSKENHAIVAWLKRGFADEQKRNIRESDKNSYIEEREN